MVLLLLVVGGGALEYGLLRAAQADDSGKAAQAWGLLSAILIVVGLLPQYYEVYKMRAVVGISYLFLLVDMSGGAFSILSLIWTEGQFDAVASASYAAVIVLEAGGWSPLGREKRLTLLALSGLFLLVPILNPSYHRRQALLECAGTERTAIGVLDEETAMGAVGRKEVASAPALQATRVT